MNLFGPYLFNKTKVKVVLALNNYEAPIKDIVRKTKSDRSIISAVVNDFEVDGIVRIHKTGLKRIVRLTTKGLIIYEHLKAISKLTDIGLG